MNPTLKAKSEAVNRRWEELVRTGVRIKVGIDFEDLIDERWHEKRGRPQFPETQWPAMPPERAFDYVIQIRGQVELFLEDGQLCRTTTIAGTYQPKPSVSMV